MPLIDAAGHRIACTQAGTSPAVVLLHGSVGDGEATWHPQLRGLRDNLTVVALGCPRRRWVLGPSESLGLSGYAGALAVFLTRLGLTRPHLMGLSFGAILALEFCTRHPERVQTLSLVSAYAGWRGSLGEDLANTRLVQAMQLSELPAAEFVDSLLPTMFRSGTPQPVVQHFADSMRSFHPRRLPRNGAGICRGPTRGVAPGAGAHPGDCWHWRCPRAAEGGHGHPRSHRRFTAGGHPDSGHVCN